MDTFTIEQLTAFIVQAKATTYVGSGQPSFAYRPDAHDLQFHAAPFSYLDSYFGGTDFIGQEVVYFEQKAIWAMNYYGYILQPDLINAGQAGKVIKQSLSQMYSQGRFLGGFECQVDEFTYTDTSEGDVSHFTGKEWITHRTDRVYELVYHGGLIKAG